MELKKIKDLMSAMKNSGIKRVHIKTQDQFELELEREDFGKVTHGAEPTAHALSLSEVSPPKNSEKGGHDIPASLHPPVETTEEVEPEGEFVTSPMVGTFYSSSSPDDPSFVNVGDKITKDTVVCIVEAMKVMNEVKGIDGTVTKILVENGHPVEFGTNLLEIKTP